MLIFDALVANRDRNPSNYGIIINQNTKKIRFAPLYDNASSLGVSMVDHRLAAAYDSSGNIVSLNALDLIVHKHIIGKVTLERHLQYKEKRQWDEAETKNVLGKIELKRKELLPFLEQGKISPSEYHKTLSKVGSSYDKYDIAKTEYEQIISYLTVFYPDEIADIIEGISNYINENSINNAFNYYQEHIPIDRMNMAKTIVLKRAKHIVEFYYNNRQERYGKII